VFRAKRNLSDRRVLITGASSGIGEALALRLSKSRARLLLTARRRERLDLLTTQIHQQGGEAHFYPGDITNPELRRELLAVSKHKLGGLDILINNAGVGGIGTFSSADEARLRQIMEVNFFAPAELIRSALPMLCESEDGLVVNVGSVLGHCAVPKKSEYCASKFALHGLTDSLRMELAEKRVDVLLVSPSTTSSEFFDQALRSEGDAARNDTSMTPATVARHIVCAMQQRRREVILSFGGKLLVWADRLAPGLMNRLLRVYG